MQRWALATVFAAAALAITPNAQTAELWRQVEIIRTAHGVPHIRAENLRAGGYALAWVMSEDYGPRTGMRLVGARGRAVAVRRARARSTPTSTNLRARARAIATYHLLDPETRDIYDGFAAGINRYVELNPASFPPGCRPTSPATTSRRCDIGDGPPAAKVRRFLAALRHRRHRPDAALSLARDGRATSTDEDGSNAWALAPSRTKSGRAILLRNPHLAWTAGYYEAHLTVPGVVDFYGDFRIGGPLTVIGGFNRHLGWATTNSNSGDLSEIYALDAGSRRSPITTCSTARRCR